MPTDGIQSSASALRYWERKQEVLSNNLANATTDGFKAERVFARLLGTALPVAEAATDFRAGSFKETGSQLDLAIQGEGFLVIDTPQGERLARTGSFGRDEAGLLVNAAGQHVLGETGPIPINGTNVSIDHTGLVTVDGKAVDRLRMERMPPNVRLQHDAGTLFIPDAGRQAIPPADRTLKQGFLEESNVSTVGSMVDMIDVQRNYAAVQKVMITLDSIRGMISNDLARLK
jgi:flagellar basal body rod protein FlgG